MINWKVKLNKEKVIVTEVLHHSNCRTIILKKNRGVYCRYKFFSLNNHSSINAYWIPCITNGLQRNFSHAVITHFATFNCEIFFPSFLTHQFLITLPHITLKWLVDSNIKNLYLLIHPQIAKSTSVLQSWIALRHNFIKWKVCSSMFKYKQGFREENGCQIFFIYCKKFLLSIHALSCTA